MKGCGWAVTPEQLEALYAERPDPWDYASSWYERRKRGVTVASLPNQRYRRCYEPGCSIGELTRLLARRCDEVLAVDCATVAVQRARQATGGLERVRVERAVLPRQLPGGSFDLIVLSELLYFFSPEDLQAVLGGVLLRLRPGGDLVAVHARPKPRWPGAELHRLLHDRPELQPLVHHEDEDFVLDVLRREESSPANSSASRECAAANDSCSAAIDSARDTAASASSGC